jgi:hypothetical protein
LQSLLITLNPEHQSGSDEKGLASGESPILSVDESAGEKLTTAVWSCYRRRRRRVIFNRE